MQCMLGRRGEFEGVADWLPVLPCGYHGCSCSTTTMGHHDYTKYVSLLRFLTSGDSYLKPFKLITGTIILALRNAHTNVAFSRPFFRTSWEPVQEREVGITRNVAHGMTV